MSNGESTDGVPDLNVSDLDSKAFFAAIREGDLAEVRRLLDETPELLSVASPEGASAALTALYHGHAPLADELAARTGSLSAFEAAAFDDTDRLAELITADATVVDSWSADGWQPLHLASYFGRAEAARVLLDSDAVADEPSRNPQHLQPLHAATAGRHSELVWLLIASDAPIDAQQRGGWTPLHAAVSNNDLPSVKALLAAGADPSISNDKGVSARQLAAELPSDTTGVAIRDLIDNA
ncbi:ankyrin repeat domain-containing protein [Jatrophihabitans sp. DSM 45814]